MILTKRMRGVSIFYLFCLLSATSFGDDAPTVVLESAIIRTRISSVDPCVMKNALFATLLVGPVPEKERMIRGDLFLGQKRIDTRTLHNSHNRYVDFIFDLPFFEQGDQPLVLRIELLTGTKHRNSRIHSFVIEHTLDQQSGVSSPKPLETTMDESGNDFRRDDNGKKDNTTIVFLGSPLEYVDPRYVPEKREAIKMISMTMASNEYEGVSVCLYRKQAFNTIAASLRWMDGPDGVLPDDFGTIGHVINRPTKKHPDENRLGLLPNVIQEQSTVTDSRKNMERFWIAFKTGKKTKPGAYRGHLIFDSDARHTVIPLLITILPLTLVEVKPIVFAMLMTYESTECCMPGNLGKEEEVRRAAYPILKDLKEHGMNTVCLHSPFLPYRAPDGRMCLEDIFNTMSLSDELGFKQGVIWYFGHLIHTAKTRHPGSIAFFNEPDDMAQLESMVDRVGKYAKAHNHPNPIFFPIDEPDDRYTPLSEKRLSAARKLLADLKDKGVTTFVTAASVLPNADIICTHQENVKRLKKAGNPNQKIICYDNDVILRSNNPAYARYMYGFFPWKTDIDGVSTWTYQTTQNARGVPGKMDTLEQEVFMAYPCAGKPMATLHWEAVREGVEDYHLLTLLEHKTALLGAIDADTSKYDNYLDQLRNLRSRPGLKHRDFHGWSPDFFASMRESLMRFILEIDQKLMLFNAAKTVRNSESKRRG